MIEIIGNLARRKVRSTLTISGIVIGVFALTTMGAMAAPLLTPGTRAALGSGKGDSHGG